MTGRAAAHDGRQTRRDSLGPIVVVTGDAAAPAGAVAARETPEGYLLIEGRINGTGVYEYEDERGNRWGELRLARHVGAPATVDSWDGKALADDHPPEMLDAANTSQYQRGTVSRPRFVPVLASDVEAGRATLEDGEGYTLARILITDAALIAKVRDGKCELSCGYSLVPVASPGTWRDGKPYKYLQTEIAGNHVAVVDVARGGPRCCLIFDAATVQRSEPMSAPKSNDDKSKGAAPPTKRDAKIMIGEAEVEVPDEVAAHIAALEAKLAGMPPMADDKAPPPVSDAATSKRLGELERALAAAQGRGDALEGRLKAFEADAAQRSLDALKARVSEACPGLKLDGLDEHAVRLAALDKLAPATAAEARKRTGDAAKKARKAERDNLRKKWGA